MDGGRSPKKKRSPPTSGDEGHLVTPKKLRVQAHALPTPSSSTNRPPKSSNISEKDELPPNLQRLLNLQLTLQQALSHALATSGISPTEDEGLIPNVLNHLCLRKHGYTMDDLRRLCWLWQWDAASLPAATISTLHEDNPFVEKEGSSDKDDWRRGSLGIIISPTTHFDRQLGKRVAVYAIGIEVEMNIEKGLSDGMAAIARWAADSKKRKDIVFQKLARWVQMHSDTAYVSLPPQLPLPPLKQPTIAKVFPLLHPRAVSRSPSPTKLRDNSSLLIQTRGNSQKKIVMELSPERADCISIASLSPRPSIPQTPSQGASRTSVLDAKGLPTPSTAREIKTPTSERRAALYERVRQRSFSGSPATSPTKQPGATEKLRAISASLLKRRCLLGRLANVAESIWMLFSGPAPSCERRALRLSAVIHAVVKSSSVPISDADADESIGILIELCPFFLRKLVLGREEWLEMPAPELSENPTKRESEDRSSEILSPSLMGSPKRIRVPAPTGIHTKSSAESLLLARSPRSVTSARGSLAQVRERIRKELESYE